MAQIQLTLLSFGLPVKDFFVFLFILLHKKLTELKVGVKLQYT